ncbi:MAG: hypothetical protein U1E69_04740 [Tabrizicola sp.]|uniref:hypothetical protein n=1 Tax=Tabrizicola sp. TaxID=2005166 RepID=UPI002ABA2266|nr:hypothetical protein [Tabrizicola sp.]MDZ4086092.1 hypothetical protein [Tabrizicola sp.]
MREGQDWFSDILDPNETVLWSGRPQDPETSIWHNADFAAGWVFALGMSAAAIAKGVDLLPVSSPSCRSAFRACAPDYIFAWVFLIAAALILYVATRTSMSSLRDRRSIRTESYAITEGRALLSRTLGGRTVVRSVPIHAELWVSYSPGPGGEIGLSRMVQGESDEGSNAFDEEMVVFRKLADPDIPYRLLREIQTRIK